MQVLFQFEGAATTAQRRTIVTRIKGRGAHTVRKVFPGEQATELANLHAAEVDNDKVEGVLRFLKDDKHVDFVEIPAERGL
jgi:hypothetical protein